MPYFCDLSIVCAAGYYRSQGACALCTGNTVKMASGDAVHCDDDDPCDGVTTVANPEHTDCGNGWVLFY